MKPSEVARSPEVERDMKKLLKRFSTLEEDLDTFIKTGMRLYHELNIDNNGIFPITGLGFEEPKVYKVRTSSPCETLSSPSSTSSPRLPAAPA